jgi:NADPH:quinone reductase-like Zn-dependent oxidoreductase
VDSIGRNFRFVRAHVSNQILFINELYTADIRRNRHPNKDIDQIDAVLDLVGNTTFMDSLSMLRRGGRMCLAGWLGGLDPVNSFNPLLQMPSGVYFTFFGSFVFGTPDFPVSDIPLQSIVDKVAKGIYKAGSSCLSIRRYSSGSRGDGIEPSKWQNGRSHLR